MKCSFNLHWLLAAWGEGTGFVLRSFRELDGTGRIRRADGQVGGLVRFYKSQCKSRNKYYLLFEERHSRYLLYRGKGPVSLEHMFGLFQSKTWWQLCSIQEWTQANTPTRNKTHNTWCSHEPGTYNISCHFSVFSFHVRMAELFIRDKWYLSDNTVAKHVERYRDFPLVHFSGIFRVKAVCTADVRKSEMLIQLQEFTWYEKKDTCSSSVYSCPTIYSPLMWTSTFLGCHCILCWDLPIKHFEEEQSFWYLMM